MPRFPLLTVEIVFLFKVHQQNFSACMAFESDLLFDSFWQEYDRAFQDWTA
jgi:hypothetical protein